MESVTKGKEECSAKEKAYFLFSRTLSREGKAVVFSQGKGKKKKKKKKRGKKG